MRVICEYQAYIEPRLTTIASGVFQGTRICPVMRSQTRCTRSPTRRAPSRDGVEVRLDRRGSCSAVDMVIFPGNPAAEACARAAQARELSSRFMPVE